MTLEPDFDDVVKIANSSPLPKCLEAHTLHRVADPVELASLFREVQKLFHEFPHPVPEGTLESLAQMLRCLTPDDILVGVHAMLDEWRQMNAFDAMWLQGTTAKTDED